MMNTTVRALSAGIAGLFLALATPVSASIIYDNGAPSAGGDSILANGASPIASDTFTLADAVDLTDIHWWGVYQGENNSVAAPGDDFSISIDEVGGGGANVFSFSGAATSKTDTGDLSGGGFRIFSFDLLSLSENLAAGTYRLTITNGTTGDGTSACNGGACDWAWMTSTDGAKGDDTHDETSGGVTISPEDDMAFNLTGNVAAVPEPGTIALLGLGLVGIGFGRRAKARKS